MSSTNKRPRPEYMTDEMFIYLDKLRLSGKTNMFGAGPYVSRRFGLDRDESHAVLGHWMDTFSDRHPPKVA